MLSVSATSRVRVTCAVTAFPRSVPVYAKAPTTVVAPPHDLLMATSSRLSILSKAWSVLSSEPVHDNEHSCVRQLISAVPQTTTRRHSTQGSRETHVHTQMYTDQQKDSDRDTIREIWKETLRHFRQAVRSVQFMTWTTVHTHIPMAEKRWSRGVEKEMTLVTRWSHRQEMSKGEKITQIH